MVLGEGLKDIHGQRYPVIFMGASVTTRLLMDKVHVPNKNALLEFMDLSDTN